MIFIYRVVRPGLITQGVKAYCKAIMRTKAQKPEYNYINIATISDEIDKCVVEFFTRYNIDIYDIQQIRTVPHNIVNLCFRYIYKTLFKPDKPLYNNQKSKIDYDNIELLSVIADKFIDICAMFNKSFGLMSFSYMTGISYTTIYNTLQNGEQLNPERLNVLKNIQECHKVAQISLLNDAPVGALAVANNDTETGLQWSANQTQQITANTVYLIPSERSNRLALEDNERSRHGV